MQRKGALDDAAIEAGNIDAAFLGHFTKPNPD